MMEVMPERLKEEMEKSTGFALVDLQDAHEYTHSHIPSAINLPAVSFMQDFAGVLKEKNQTIVVYEAYDELGKSAEAAQFLESQGYTKIGRLTGGLRAWQNAGFVTDGGVES